MKNKVLHELGFGGVFTFGLAGVISSIAFFGVDFCLYAAFWDSGSTFPVIFFTVSACLAGLAVWVGIRRAKYRHVVVGLFCGWILAAMVFLGYVRSLHPSRIQLEAANPCINTLRLIDSAKQQWALEQRKQNTDTPAGSDLQPYLGRGMAGELPYCEMDTNQSFATSYSINNVGTKPTCKICPSTHILP